MSDIFGMAFQNGSTFTNGVKANYILRELFNESKIYSSKSSSVVFTTPKEIAIMRSLVPADDFVKSKEYVEASRKYVNLQETEAVVSVIGYCASDDSKNSESPVSVNGIVGACDGSIHNYGSLSSEFSNDIEESDKGLIFKLIDYFKNKRDMSMPYAVAYTAMLASGNYTCVIVEKSNPFLLWIIRGKGPLVVKQYGCCGLILFSTRSSLISNVVHGMDLGLDPNQTSSVLIPDDRSACINLFSNKMSIYKSLSKSKA